MNFPYKKLLKIKLEKYLNEGENIKTKIIEVDPNLCYKDNSVQRFKELFIKIFKNTKEYWKN